VIPHSAVDNGFVSEEFRPEGLAQVIAVPANKSGRSSYLAALKKGILSLIENAPQFLRRRVSALQ